MKTTAIERCRPFEQTPESTAPLKLHSRRTGARFHGGVRIRDLQEADRRKDQFLAMLGHEMRNPLAPIRNAMQIVRSKAASDPELLGFD